MLDDIQKLSGSISTVLYAYFWYYQYFISLKTLAENSFNQMAKLLRMAGNLCAKKRRYYLLKIIESNLTPVFKFYRVWKLFKSMTKAYYKRDMLIKMEYKNNKLRIISK